MGLARPRLPILGLPILAHVVPASSLPAAQNRGSIWNLDGLAGRLVELSASAESAHLTAAFGLVLDAQLNGDNAAWVTLEHSSFFPPDVAEGGIDLDALPVVRVRDVRTAGRAADHLVRSGGFGLVVIDISNEQEAGPRKSRDWKSRDSHKLQMPLMTRLLGLARQQNVAVLFLTKKSREAASLPLISLRAEARWQRREGHYQLSVEVIKDKCSGRKWTQVENCRGPAGLR